MDRRKFLKYISTGTAALLISDVLGKVITKKGVPHIIIIFAEDIEKKHIDSLQDKYCLEGVRLNNFVSCGGSFEASMVGLMTGMYPQRFGAKAMLERKFRSEEFVISRDTFADRLESVGYKCAIATKRKILEGSMSYKNIDRTGIKGEIYNNNFVKKFISENRDNKFLFTLPVKGNSETVKEVFGAVWQGLSENSIINDTFLFFCGLGNSRDFKDMTGSAFIYWDGFSVLDRACCANVSVLDVFGTIVRIAEVGKYVSDGTDVFNIIKDPKRYRGRHLFRSHSGSWAVRKDGWELVMNRCGDNKGMYLLDVENRKSVERNHERFDMIKAKGLMSFKKILEDSFI